MKRITPAPAGKTKVSDAYFEVLEDHPRTCGENFPLRTSCIHILGSPPHLRGKLLIPSLVSHLERITPAPAGKTLLCLLIITYVWITPAPAGKTTYKTGTKMSSSDHPRTCGENLLCGMKQKRKGGSPPHLRGKLEVAMSVNLDIRITPAPAGKTRIQMLQTWATQDHPRTCGENTKK